MDPRHWLFRIGDGRNFQNGIQHKTWAITAHAKTFKTDAKPGDILWFVKKGSNGNAYAVATLVSQSKRELGPLIALDLTNEELGWEGEGGWDTKIIYTDLYILESTPIDTGIQGQFPVHQYRSPREGADDLREAYRWIRRLLTPQNGFVRT
jgi:hypothetical protein